MASGRDDDVTMQIYWNKRKCLHKNQTVCVTTHKGSWVKLLLCFVSIVTRSSSHL